MLRKKQPVARLKTRLGEFVNNHIQLVKTEHNDILTNEYLMEKVFDN